jgi:predicted ArsR family transcriptional regulator
LALTAVASRAVNDGEQDPIRIDWEDVGRVEQHIRRFGIIQILLLDGGRTLSPTECAYELHTNTPDANYHMKVLAKSGIVRLAQIVPVRGVAEHFYCLTEHSADDLFERLGLPRKDR